MSLFEMLSRPPLWFSAQPVALNGLEISIVGVKILLFIALGIFFSVLASRKQKSDALAARVFGKFSRWFLTWGALGLLWAFFAYERIRLLGAFFWLIIFTLVAIVWLIFAIRYTWWIVPMLRAREAERIEREKYLPGNQS